MWIKYNNETVNLDNVTTIRTSIRNNGFCIVLKMINETSNGDSLVFNFNSESEMKSALYQIETNLDKLIKI